MKEIRKARARSTSATDRHWRPWRTLVAVAAGAILLPAAVLPASAADMAKLNVMQSPASLYSWATYVAQEKGYFKQNGLEVNFIQSLNGGTTMQGLLSGSMDVGNLDLTLSGPVIQKGTAMTLIMGISLANYIIVAGKDVALPNLSKGFPQSIADLRGKKIGIYGLGTSSQRYLQALLDAAGLSSSDVQMLPTGGEAQQEAAVLSGQVDAAVLAPDGAFPLLRDGSVREVYDFSKRANGVPANSILARVSGQPQIGDWSVTSWAQDHKDLVKQFQTAVMQADVWMHDPANFDELFGMLQTFGMRKLPQDEQRALVQAMLPQLISYYSVDAAQAQDDFLVKYGVLDKPIPVADFLWPDIPSDQNGVHQAAMAAH